MTLFQEEIASGKKLLTYLEERHFISCKVLLLVDCILIVYDILCRNSQDEIYTFDQEYYEVKPCKCI